MKNMILNVFLLIGTVMLASSCCNDDDYIQEGILRVSFSNLSSISNDAKVSVEIMDIANREHVIVEKITYGNCPIEITLNTGNYLVRIMSGSLIKLQGIQIRKDKVTELSLSQ